MYVRATYIDIWEMIARGVGIDIVKFVKENRHLFHHLENTLSSTYMSDDTASK